MSAIQQASGLICPIPAQQAAHNAVMPRVGNARHQTPILRQPLAEAFQRVNWLVEMFQHIRANDRIERLIAETEFRLLDVVNEDVIQDGFRRLSGDSIQFNPHNLGCLPRLDPVS